MTSHYPPYYTASVLASELVPSAVRPRLHLLLLLLVEWSVRKVTRFS